MTEKQTAEKQAAEKQAAEKQAAEKQVAEKQVTKKQAAGETFFYNISIHWLSGPLESSTLKECESGVSFFVLQ